VGLGAGVDEQGKSRPIPVFDHRTAQPVASHCTDHAYPTPLKIRTVHDLTVVIMRLT
jgi:hypothetical protein